MSRLGDRVADGHYGGFGAKVSAIHRREATVFNAPYVGEYERARPALTDFPPAALSFTVVDAVALEHDADCRGDRIDTTGYHDGRRVSRCLDCRATEVAHP